MRFMGIDSDIDRPRIQALRASPPGFAANKGARRRVFRAALGARRTVVDGDTMSFVGDPETSAICHTHSAQIAP
jgi:hypothetical protein